MKIMIKNKKPEKMFFSFLKDSFSKNDYKKISKKLVPKKSSNFLNRFYNPDSIWFSRLKINDQKTIYYFGLDNDKSKNNDIINPKFLLKIDKNSISSLRFSKNDVYILIKVLSSSEAYNQIKKSFSLKYATKNKDSDLYYLKLGALNSDILINNIKFLLENFDFELNLRKNYLKILNYNNNYFLPDGYSDFINYLNTTFKEDTFSNKIIKSDNLSREDSDDFDSDSNSSFKEDTFTNKIIKSDDFSNLNILKFNLYSLNLKKLIKNLNLSPEDKIKLNEYLFNTTKSKDYEFNDNIIKTVNIDKTFDILTNSISNSPNNLKYIIENINNDLKKYYNEISSNKVSSDSSTDKNTIKSSKEVMEQILIYLNEGYSKAEAAKIINIEEKLIDTWIFNGEKSLTPNSIYFFKEYNKILKNSEDSADENSDESIVYFDYNDINLNDNQKEIYDEFLMLKEDGFFDFYASSYDISDENQKLIFEKIVMDIQKNIISEDDDTEEILESYFDEFSNDNNADNMAIYYNNVVNSDFYKNLYNKYDLDKESINQIHNLVKMDMESNNFTEDDIKQRFNIFFMNKSKEISYVRKLNSLKLDDFLKYNLTASEFNDIKNETLSIIRNWHANFLLFNSSFKEIWDRQLNKKIDYIKSKSRRKFEINFNNKSVIKNILEVSELSDREFNNLKKLIFKEIDYLNIKYEDINENLIKEYYKNI